MTWARNRPTTHIPAAVKRFVRGRAGDECELRLVGVCRVDYNLQYDHYGQPGVTPDGVAESGGPALVSNDPEHVRLVCEPCHNVHTQQQARRGMNAWKLQPERHPGLRY